MRVLVTGGCGYIGSHTVLRLSEAGHEVVVIDNLSTGFEDALLHGERLIVGDLGDESTLKEAFSGKPYDAVVHFAASAVVTESVADPLKYYDNNTCSTIKLLQWVKKTGVGHFVFSSTAAVYGEQQNSVQEHCPTRPTNAYGRSKLMVEWVLDDLAKAMPMTYAVLRYFNVAGADSLGRLGQRSANATHLIKVACQVAVGIRDVLEVYGDDYPTKDGTCVRDYIHVADLADAHLAALNYLVGGGRSEVINCGYGRGYSVREVIDALEEVCGKRLPTKLAPRRPGDVTKLVADVDKATRLLEWKPRFADLKVIAESAWRWELSLTEQTR